MVQILDYKIEEQINTEVGVKIFRGKSPQKEPIILKLIPEVDELSENVVNLKNEYEILKYLESPNMVKAIAYEKTESGYLLVLEDIGGKSLKELIQNGAVSIADFLNYGIQICSILSEIHRKRVIHKDIKPSNIIVNEKKEIRIIDFGISSRLSKEETKLTAPNVLEGSIQYISPEQTGRMNRTVDYRTDFYSLGVTFFELITGDVPFKSEDLLELVHFHLAKIPDPPHKLNPNIPLAISEIILKLMEKTAEKRYQTALGVRADLENCLEQLKSSGTINSFPLGKKDIKEEFSIPQKLYGREVEVDKLLKSFDSMNDTGLPSMMLIGGYSGVGKSALIKEINKPLTESRGYFVSGKYDQFNKNLPFSAIIQVFTNLIRLILTEEPEKIVNWQKNLRDALGVNVGVITEVIPDLEIILGKSEPLPELGSQENANRFYLTFLNFIKVFAQREHPLALFLDDLQWADSSSFTLLKNLMEDPSVRFLYIIIAYRENEVEKGHPLLQLIDDLKAANLKIESISLAPLAIDRVQELLSDSLYKERVDCLDLAELIHAKTGGNPFFITELLRQLIREQLIRFVFEENQWKWDLRKIKDAKISDNVVELLLNRIKLLPDSVRNIMQLASCIGNEFELFTLSVISNINPFKVAKELREIVAEDLAIPIGDSYKRSALLTEDNADDTFKKSKKIKYRFQHDRVQQAAYELIDINKKKIIRLDIGRTLLNNLKDSEIDEKIFDIVNHLNEGIEFIESKKEKKRLIDLNLKAGKKAKSATAYKPALDYLRIAKTLLGNDSWSEIYDITYKVYKELVELEYLNKNFEESEKLAFSSLVKIKSNLEKGEIYKLLINQYILTAKYSQAIDSLRKALTPIGIIIPEDESEYQGLLGGEFQEAITNLRNRDILSLINDPEIKNPELKMAIKLMTTTMPASYILNPSLWTLIVMKTVNIGLKNGIVAESYGYVCYGILLGAAFQKYLDGYNFALLAYEISKKFDNKAEISKASNVLANHVLPWIKPIKDANPINKSGMFAGLESGELVHAGFCAAQIPGNYFYQGLTLGKLQEEINELLPQAQKLKNDLAIDMITGVNLAVANLMGLTEGRASFTFKGLSLEDYLKNATKRNNLLAVFLLKIMIFQINFYYNNYSESKKMIEEITGSLQYITGLISVGEFNFYHSLLLCAMYPTLPKKEQEDYFSQIEKNQVQLKTWAENSKENFLHKYLLVEAEKARITRDKWKAAELFEKAISEAHEHGFIQNEALGLELAGNFWIENDNEKFAFNYLFAAMHRYEKWGAIRKVEHLREKYPSLEMERRRDLNNVNKTKSKSIVSTTSNSSQSLDLQSVFKSSAAISSEIRLDSLLEKLIQILIENAGAEKGILLLKENRSFVVKAEGLIGETRILQTPLNEYKNIASSVIYFVERTKENLVLSDANADEKFKNDKYIDKNGVKSVLCAPVIKQGELIGILYLENNLTTNAFTQDRLKIVNLLSSQAAISIENAILYSEMEQKVKDRTAQLAEKNEELAEKNNHITDSINYAKTIQTAILPSKSTLVKNFQDFFILFRPKDIVSGDFYWFTSFEDYVFIAAVDCTGHGVPGALMSMLGKSILDQVVNEKKIVKPSEILKHLDYNVRIALKQDREESESRDGMDMGLCRISKNELIFAGAKRPLYSVIDGKIETHKGDKDSIGGKVTKADMKEFNDITFKLEKGNRKSFYLSTDGFADQPDPERKKIGSRGLIELIENNYSLPGLKQKEVFEKFLDNHQKGEPQRDDITLIGIMI